MRNSRLLPCLFFGGLLAAGCSDLNGDWTLYPAESRPSLTISDRCPAADSTDFFTGGVIKVSFSKDLDPATADQQAFLLGQGRRLIRGAILLDERTITYVPSEILLDDTTYNFYITDSLRDRDGFAITSNYLVYSFATGTPGAVSCR